MTYASVPRRWLARVVDVIFLYLAFLVIATLVDRVLSPFPETFQWLVAFALVPVYLVSLAAYPIVTLVKGGASIGMMVLRIKAVQEDGSPMDWTTVIFRSLFSIVSALCLGTGYLAAFWSKKTQTWHDKWSGTVVIVVAAPLSDE